ncbi:MAG: hypothetical protein ACKN9W_04360 [Methylococcus sp.]
MTHYLLLEHLKAIRADLHAVKTDIRDIKTRLLAMESYQAASHIDAARQSARLDEFDARLSRLEIRVNLAD